MDQKLLHTPEGVRDIYNDECARKLTLQRDLNANMKLYGYQDIETPTFEFFDVFGNEVGTTPSNELYKFFDRDGNTLVLRPDITPSIARASAKYFDAQDFPLRLCYAGNTFINNSSYQGRLKESTQLGAELIGDNSAEADAEIIAMVVDSLLKAGLKEFQISIGHVDFLRSLIEEAGIDQDSEAELKILISNKNNFGVEELLGKLNISDELRALFVNLPNMYGTCDVLNKASGMTANEHALAALARLQKIYRLLQVYGYEKYVSFDLGMFNKYMYYTGVIFRAYTFGTGDAIVKGGRYDRLLAHFGNDAPSIGFVVIVEQLLTALSRQKIPVETAPVPKQITYHQGQREEAIKEAMKLRGMGQCVALVRLD